MTVLWKPSEEELQANVLRTAGLLGWRYYHTRDSRKSAGGFPDLVLVRPPRLVFVELKRLPERLAAGRPTAEQQAWIEDLSEIDRLIRADAAACRPDDIGREIRSGQPHRWPGIPSVEVYIWRPAHWLDGSIEAVLR
jgi:hypothetical protein